MPQKAVSIRPFIGAKDFELSRRFYQDLGFEESIISPEMSLFRISGLGFYLQHYYVQEWVDNTMLFVEVADVKLYYEELVSLELPQKYPGVRLLPIRVNDWGSECFLHDPSGILWHFGAFNP